jgi:hypothetical protein
MKQIKKSKDFSFLENHFNSQENELVKDINEGKLDEFYYIIK